MGVSLSDINLASPDSFVDGVPHEWFEYLRKERPIHWQEYGTKGKGFWVLTRHADVAMVNRDWETFSSEKDGVVIQTEGPAADADADDMGNAQNGLMMLMMDPPKHTRYRLLVNKGFTPRMVGGLEPHVRELANKIIDRVIEKGECDFVTDIAAELPLAVIAEMMGVPEADWHKIFEWSNRMIGSADPEYNTSMEEVMNASMEMFAYSNSLANEKRGCPADDIVSKLLTAEIQGDKLSEMEFDLFFLLLAVAGNETTRNLVSHAMLALIENPDQRQKLLDDPAKIPHATEEFLRWGTPVMNFKRSATRNYELHGQKIREGDAVVIYYISANRDETVFENPHSFDVERTPNDHIAFGAGGPHFCLGANLARQEIRVAFEEVLRRMPDIQLAGEPSRLRSNFINGIKHLPISFTPGPKELS